MWTGDQYDKWLSNPECYAFVNVSTDEEDDEEEPDEEITGSERILN